MFGKYLFVCPFLVPMLFVPSSTSAADKPQPNPALNGSWQADLSDSQSLLLRIEQDQIELKINIDGKQSLVWVGKIALSKEHPDKHMDWTNLKSGEASFPDNRCLFKLAENTLLVIGGGPTDRPTRFYSGPGSEPRTLVFLRVAPSKENSKPTNAP